MKKGAKILLALVLALVLPDLSPAGEIHEAAERGDLEKVQAIVAGDPAAVNARDEKVGWTPLLFAAFMGHAEVVEFLLDHGAEVNARSDRGWSALHQSALSGHGGVDRVAALLLARGANVDAVNNDGDTPLIVAARHDHRATALVLLEGGAKVDVAPSGSTALEWAIQLGYKETCGLLLDQGVDVNRGDKKGNTPLHQAALFNRTEIILLLLNQGAEVNTKNKNGETPLACAHKMGNKEAAKLLRESGGEE